MRAPASLAVSADSAALIEEVEALSSARIDKDKQDVATLAGIEAVWIEGICYVQSLSAAVDTFPPGTWALVSTVPATQTDSYLAEVPTEADSSGTGTAYSVFVVTTHTTTPSVWFTSVPDSGYSVDNLAPAPPAAFQVTYNAPGGNLMEWDESQEEDLSHYAVYRGSGTPAARSLQAAEPADDFTLVHTTVETSWLDGIEEGWRYAYKLAVVDHSGNESVLTAPGTVTGVGAPVVPDQFALYPNIPNPFNPTTRIRFDVPAGGANVTLRIYDVSGGLVRTLVDGMQTEGQKNATWDGRNDSGRLVATGMYFYRLTAPGFLKTRKMVLLK